MFICEAILDRSRHVQSERGGEEGGSGYTKSMGGNVSEVKLVFLCNHTEARHLILVL